MYYKLLQLLNIKPHESAVVRKLFTIQFFLGVAAAFQNRGLLAEEDPNALSHSNDHNFQVLLKAFALLYDREKIDRVIELLSLGNTVKISNAIEISELIIPKKYFAALNRLIELIDDAQHHDLITTKNNALPANAIIEEVLKDNKANFSEWTRSVACYMMPKLKKNEFSLTILDRNASKDDHLFNETRNYVLTMLK